MNKGPLTAYQQRMNKKLADRQHETKHNHDAPGRLVYMGYSPKVPSYHLWHCELVSDAPRKDLELVPFNRTIFDSESKAGRGGCSMKDCPSDAVMMNRYHTHAYCEMDVERANPRPAPCPYTSIEMCPDILNLDKGLPEYKKDPCKTCRSLRRRIA